MISARVASQSAFGLSIPDLMQIVRWRGLSISDDQSGIFCVTEKEPLIICQIEHGIDRVKRQKCALKVYSGFALIE